MHPATPLPPVTLRQAEALVNIPYLPRTQDCMHLALHAQQVLWGRTVGQPSGRHPLAPRHQAKAIQAGIGTLARPLADGEAAQPGDVVLWLADGDLGPQYHIGTLLHHAGEQWVLHTSEELGASVLQRLAECRMWGLRIEGIYRWL